MLLGSFLVRAGRAIAGDGRLGIGALALGKRG